MAIVEETIGSGKTRATVTLWEANVGSFGTDTYKGIIQESAEFNENVDLAGGAGTPSITSYLWLTTDPANRHAGVAGTGHGRMRGSTNGSHVLTVSADFTRIDWLEIQQDSTGSSDEGIRVNGDDVLIDYDIIWSDTDTDEQDGIHSGGNVGVVRRSISNCIVYGFRRSQIIFQDLNAQADTYTGNIDHCTLIHTSTTAPSTIEHGAVHMRAGNASDSVTQAVRNTIGYMEIDTTEPFADGSGNNRTAPTGTVIWNGSNNLRGDQSTSAEIDGTDNTTAWQSATDGDAEVSKSSGSWVVFKDITSGSENFLLLDNAAGNLAAGNGTDRQGSEPDSRQDFSVDITGTARSTTTVDIGAHNLSLTVTLYATGDGTITDLEDETGATASLWESIDDDPATPTDADWINNINELSGGDASGFFDITNMPGDFGNADGASIVVRVAANDVAATHKLYVRLFKSDESTTISDEVVLVNVSSSSGFTNYEGTITGVSATATKAEWDAARIRLRWSVT